MKCHALFVSISILTTSGCGPQLAKVQKLVELGQLEAATQALQPIIQDHPDCAKCFFLLGNIDAALSLKDDGTREAKEKLIKDAVAAYSSASKLDPHMDRALLNSAALGRLIGKDPAPVLKDLPTESLANSAALRASLLEGTTDAVPLDEALGKSVFQGWQPVLGAKKGPPTSLIVVEKAAEVTCPDKKACDSFSRGAIIRPSRVDAERAYFLHHFPSNQVGWRQTPSEFPAGTWIFRKAPPECPHTGMMWPAYVGFLENLPHFDGARASNFRSTGKRVVTHRDDVDWGGTKCPGTHPGTAFEWEEVSFQQDETDERSVRLADAVRGTGSDADRVAQIISSWPDDLIRHLLKGELAQGVSLRMAKAALGTDARPKLTKVEPETIEESVRFFTAGTTATFKNGLLTSWTTE